MDSPPEAYTPEAYTSESDGMHELSPNAAAFVPNYEQFSTYGVPQYDVPRYYVLPHHGTYSGCHYHYDDPNAGWHHYYPNQ
jgi:hypothetical protein